MRRVENPSELLKIAADHFPGLRVLATGSSTLGARARFRHTLSGRKRHLHLVIRPFSSNRQGKIKDGGKSLGTDGIVSFVIQYQTDDVSSTLPQSCAMLILVNRLSYFLSIPALLALGACSKPATSDNESASPEEERRFITFGTAPPGGTFFVVGAAIAEALQAAAGERPYTVSAESTKGSTENIRRLTQGEFDFTMSNAAVTWYAVRGEGEWAGEPEAITSIATMAPNVAFFITPEKSDIKQIADLKGKRVVVGPAGSGMEAFIEPILNAHGVTYDDFTPLHQGQAGAVELLQDGAADAAFLGGAVPTASIVQAAATQPIRFIPFDPETRTALVEKYDFFDPFTIPAGTYSGQETDYDCLNVGSMHLITRADQDEDFVYWLTKSVYEAADEIASKHPAGKSLNAKNVAIETGTPFHPGAIRYYKEIGIWPESATPQAAE